MLGGKNMNYDYPYHITIQREGDVFRVKCCWWDAIWHKVDFTAPTYKEALAKLAQQEGW
jgi:hypothetical protein